ncbi:MAG: hypothetical protein ISS33_00310 [Candidatus Omnitrophica bacterium]|nr:hypothetical protein [Candidatus Omnitrophota bacterium]
MFITAPAKVNLFLRVLNKRNDGYHSIETIFEKISLCDEINIDVIDDRTPIPPRRWNEFHLRGGIGGDETDTGIRIECDDPSIPVCSDSLMGRTVRLFKEKAAVNDNFIIKLKKNIPSGGGLGGGSSDAAAILRAMNKITGQKLNKTSLLDIAGKLGADVPFFLNDANFACGKGRGDIITKLEFERKIWHVLVIPPFKILTKDVYGRFSPFGLTKDIALDRMFSAFLEDKNSGSLAKNLHNDLQPIVLREFPVLKKVFRELEGAGALGTLLSGSGSTVFGIFDEEVVRQAEKRLLGAFPKEENWRICVVSTY